MRATASRFRVTSATDAPIRAAARAASHPAWPAPMTTTSTFISLPDAKRAEDPVIEIVRRHLSGDLADVAEGFSQVLERGFLGEAGGLSPAGRLEADDRRFHRCGVPRARHRRGFDERPARKSRDD